MSDQKKGLLDDGQLAQLQAAVTLLQNVEKSHRKNVPQADRYAAQMVDDKDAQALAAAAAFAQLDDDHQAKFFCFVGKIAALTYEGGGGHGQWWAVGRHLLECRCSNWEGREVISEICGAMVYERDQPYLRVDESGWPSQVVLLPIEDLRTGRRRIAFEGKSWPHRSRHVIQYLLPFAARVAEHVATVEEAEKRIRDREEEYRRQG